MRSAAALVRNYCKIDAKSIEEIREKTEGDYLNTGSKLGAFRRVSSRIPEQYAELPDLVSGNDVSDALLSRGPVEPFSRLTTMAYECPEGRHRKGGMITWR